MKQIRRILVVLSMLLTSSSIAFAQTPLNPQDIQVIGAEKAGNADKTIPAWSGGVTSMSGSQPGGPYADPFVSDTVTLVITGANAEQHRAKLTVGQYEMLKKYSTFKLNVYPTRRSAPLAKCVVDETLANKGKATITGNGQGITGITGGVPFPGTADGQEMMWNALMRNRGDTYLQKWAQAAVGADGKFSISRWEIELDHHFGACGKKTNEREANRLLNYMHRVTEPARLAGNLLLAQETVDQTRDARSAWTYNPGQRRVRLAPEVSYDNPGFGAESLRTADDLTLFNGAPDRYEWKLVGKKEIYIPYNSHKAIDAKVPLETLTDPSHLNPDLMRYELHRVYVVDGRLKAGSAHLYNRRTFYIDEDSHMIVATDKYGSGGKFWRYAEMHSVPLPDMGFLHGVMDVHYELTTGRYLVSGIRNGEPKIAASIKRTSGEYTPQRLRGEGTR